MHSSSLQKSGLISNFISNLALVCQKTIIFAPFQTFLSIQYTNSMDAKPSENESCNYRSLFSSGISKPFLELEQKLR